MTARYICCRCDARAESSVGHHICEAPSDQGIDRAIVRALGWPIVAPCTSDDESCIGVVDVPRLGKLHIAGFWSWSTSQDAGLRDLAPEALSRGYRWTLSSVGDGTEYRATFERHLGSPAPSAIDRTPARAFARAWLRTIEAAQRAAEVAA